MMRCRWVSLSKCGPVPQRTPGPGSETLATTNMQARGRKPDRTLLLRWPRTTCCCASHRSLRQDTSIIIVMPDQLGKQIAKWSLVDHTGDTRATISD